MGSPVLVDTTRKHDTGGNTSSHTVDTPTHSEGDELYFAMAMGGNQTITLTGWTALYSNIDIRTGDIRATFALFHKTAGASEPTTITATSGSSERSAIVAWSLSGDNGIDGSSTVNDGESTTATCPTLTPTETHTKALLIVATDADTLTHSTPTGWAELNSAHRASGGTVSIKHKDLSTLDATGAQNITIASSNEWIGATVIVKGTPVTSTGIKLIGNHSPIKSLVNGGLVT